MKSQHWAGQGHIARAPRCYCGETGSGRADGRRCAEPARTSPAFANAMPAISSALILNSLVRNTTHGLDIGTSDGSRGARPELVLPAGGRWRLSSRQRQGAVNWSIELVGRVRAERSVSMPD